MIGNGCEAIQWSVSKLTSGYLTEDREFLKMFVQRVLLCLHIEAHFLLFPLAVSECHVLR